VPAAAGRDNEPGLASVDPHHHLCERDEHRYLIPELLADTGRGHNITRIGSMYRAEGPVEMKPVGRKKQAHSRIRLFRLFGRRIGPRALAIHYGVAWTPGAFAQFSGAVSGDAITWWILRYGLREILKLIPDGGQHSGPSTQPR
jgi:hypothetical protein